MKKLLIGSLLSLSSLSAFANEGYFGGEILLGKTDQDLKSEFGNSSGDDTSFGVRGSYNLSKSSAFELSYVSHGETNDTYIDEFGDFISERISSSALNVGYKGSVPLEGGVSLHARFGLSFWDVELSATDSSFAGVTFKGDDSGSDIYYGIGAQFAISEKFTIGVEYTLSEYSIKPNKSFEGLSADVEVKTFAISAGTVF